MYLRSFSLHIHTDSYTLTITGQKQSQRHSSSLPREIQDRAKVPGRYVIAK